ncbi:MAG: hypothetical protein KDA61_11825, partial [Planctomycetales bacterium]|nr:hypothetical protein [Planctomycetales bacterium]
MSNSTVSDNSASTGGGIYNRGSATITGSTIEGNSAPQNGGGVYSGSFAFTLADSTVASNSASDGGGIYIDTNGTATISNSTLSGNTANTGIARGGAISFHSVNKRLAVTHSTVAHNTSSISSAIFLSGEATIDNTLFAHNSEHSAIIGPDRSLAGRGNMSDSFVSSEVDWEFEVVDELPLGPLADNGGPTRTHALLLGSPAIDAGDPDFAGPP